MMLAAGKSTRLGTLGAQRPKPLVPICGYPAIAFGLARCARAGLRDVVVNLHHHGDQIRDAIGDGAAFGVNVRYSQEDDLLGTGGGVARARSMFAPGPLLIINGKVVADVSLEAVIAAHRNAPRGTLATMVLRKERKVSSPVTIDEMGRVIGMRGRRGQVTAYGAATDMLFTGIHILEPALMDRLPDGESDILTAAYQPALEDSARINSFIMSGYFEEHSTPQRYLAGNLALLRQPGLLSTPPGPLTGIDPQARIEAGAMIRPPVRLAAGAVVESGAVVGPDVAVASGGRVKTRARLSRAVVWEGGVADGILADCVVTPEGVITAG